MFSRLQCANPQGLSLRRQVLGIDPLQITYERWPLLLDFILTLSSADLLSDGVHRQRDCCAQRRSHSRQSAPREERSGKACELISFCCVILLRSRLIPLLAHVPLVGESRELAVKWSSICRSLSRCGREAAAGLLIGSSSTTATTATSWLRRLKT
jgi:hypothetical protein